MDEASSGEIERLLDVFQSSRHTANDIQTLQRKLKRRCAGHHSGISRESNCHNRSAWSEESRSSSVALFRSCEDDNTVGAILRDACDLAGHVLDAHEVEVLFRAQVLAQLGFLL